MTLTTSSDLFITLLDRFGEKHGGEISPIFTKHLGGGKVRTALEDLQVNPVFTIESLFVGDVIAGKLGLGEPLGQKGHGAEFTGHRDCGEKAKERCDYDIDTDFN